MFPNYNSAVLMGNWQEDKSKAPELHGGIADLGFREYSVCYRDDYTAPPVGASVSFKRRPDRYGMMSRQTVNEAAFCYGAGMLKGGFDMTLSGAAKLQTSDDTLAQYRTNMQDAVEAGSSLGRAAAIRAAKDLAQIARSQLSKPAGGQPSVNIDRGKHTAGIAGEMLNLEGDARRNTLAQRSWMYGPDPGLKFTLNKPTPRPEVTGLSLNVGGVPPEAAAAGPQRHGRFAAFQAQARISTDITSAATGVVTKGGRRVFIDDP